MHIPGLWLLVPFTCEPLLGIICSSNFHININFVQFYQYICCVFLKHVVQNVIIRCYVRIFISIRSFQIQHKLSTRTSTASIGISWVSHTYHICYISTKVDHSKEKRKKEKRNIPHMRLKQSYHISKKGMQIYHGDRFEDFQCRRTISRWSMPSFPRFSYMLVVKK